MDFTSCDTQGICVTTLNRNHETFFVGSTVLTAIRTFILFSMYKISGKNDGTCNWRTIIFFFFASLECGWTTQQFEATVKKNILTLTDD